MTDAKRTPLEEHFYQAWEKEETFTQENIGIVQLRKAIEHFMMHDYIPAVTLAGAAAEILGRRAKEVHGEQAVDRYCRQRKAEWELVGRQIPLTTIDLFKYLHWVKNSLKHNEHGTNEALTRYYGRSAVELIDAALLNLFLISDFQPPADDVVAKYHHEYPTWGGEIPCRPTESPEPSCA